MKRFASILLLLILCFNWIGYRFLSAYLEDRANSRLEQQLDANSYDESQLITIKVPVEHLAYYNNSKEFERTDGQIDINGIEYKYVKKRIYKDSLEYLCIPNNDVMKLSTAKDEFFKLVNDLQHNGQDKKTSQHSGVSKNFIPDYDLGSESYHLMPLSLRDDQKSTFCLSFLAHAYIPASEQPPEAC